VTVEKKRKKKKSVHMLLILSLSSYVNTLHYIEPSKTNGCNNVGAPNKTFT